MLVFRKGDAFRFATWTTGSSHQVLLPVNVGHYNVMKHTGQEVDNLRSDQKGLRLTLSNAPSYFR